MLHLSIIILQSTIQYTTAVTRPYVSYYWKTTEEIDKIPDYWNHGPIDIPGLQDIFTITTKPPDIFPPWLTRSTKRTTGTEMSTAKTENPTTNTRPTVNFLTPQSQPHIDKTTTEQISILQKIQQSWRLLLMSKPTQYETTTKLNMRSTNYEYNEATDPFSVFLRKLFKSLATKSLPELPALINPIVAYMEKLLHDNALQWLGDMVPYVQKVVKGIRTFLSSTSPSILHTKCYEVYAVLSNHSALGTDYTDLLTTLDDMYTEAEEEHMQRVLRDVIEFPNSDITAQAIANEFVNNLILLPMKRVLGTSKGDEVLFMLKRVIEKRGLRRNWNLKFNNRAITSYEDNDETSNENDVQHSIHKFRARETPSKEKTINASKGYTEGIYQTVQNNIDDINSLMKNIEISSSETNEYELSSLESEEIVKKSTDNIKTPSLPYTQSLRSDKSKALRKGSLEKIYEEYKENSSSSEIIQYELSSSLESEEIGKQAADNIYIVNVQSNKNKTLRKGSSLEELYINNKKKISSSETIQYELSSNLESEERIEEIGDINTFQFRSNKDKMLRKESHDELYKNNKKNLRYKKNKVMSDKFHSFFNKYDVIPRVPNKNYRRGKVDVYKNTKPTILVPELPLWTKIIKDSARQYDNPQNTPQHKLISSGNTYINEDRNKMITKSIKEIRYKVFSKKPLTVTYPSRHPFTMLYLTTKNTSFYLKRKPNNPTIGKYIESTQMYKDKPMTQMNSNQNANKGTTNYFVHDKIETSRIQQTYMNKTKHNVIGEYVNIAHQNVKELEDSTLNTEYSSEDTGEHANRVEKTLSSPLEHPQGRAKNKKHRIRPGNHRQRNRHEKRKHKHGHRHSHYKKRKYENLKRKYQKLKQLFAQNRINNDSDMSEINKKLVDLRMKPLTIKINYHNTFPSLFGKLNQRATNADARNKQHAERNTYLFTAVTQEPEINLRLRHRRPKKNNIRNSVPTTKVVKVLKDKKINMFLDDYDYDGKLEIPQSKTPFKKTNNTPYYTKITKAHTLFNGDRIIRKSFPQNATTGKGFKLSEDSDAEKELKKNIYDAFRHMDFNVSRSYHDDTTSKAHLQDSQETDVEAVLKSNIYKAVKKLLKK